MKRRLAPLVQPSDGGALTKVPVKARVSSFVLEVVLTVAQKLVLHCLMKLKR